MNDRFFRNEQERNYFVKGLLKKHQATLIIQARNLCRDNKVEAEELFQEFTLKLLEKADWVYKGYEKDGKGVAYLSAMLKNTYRDMLRKKNRKTENEHQYGSFTRSRQKTPEDIFVEQETEELINDALKSGNFNAEDREIYHMKLTGWKQSEIAAHKKMNDNTVYTKIYRMKNHLMKMFT